MTEPEAPRSGTAVRIATAFTMFVLLLGAAVSLFVIVTATVGAIRGGQDVSLRQDVATGDLHAMPRSVERPGTVPVTVHIRDATTRQELLALGRDIGPILLVLTGLWLIRSVLLSVRRGDPFNSENVHRLRYIALLLIAGVPLVQLLQRELATALADTTGINGLVSNGTFSLNAPLAGIGVLVLAEVFAHGVRLREDVEGTI